MTLRSILLLSVLFIMFSAESICFAQEKEVSKKRQSLNDGYYLIHQLCGDEAQLPLLLVVKDSPKEIETFADRVSKTAKESLATLDHMREHDSQMDWDKNPLPPIEQDIRASITDEKQHQLLFGSKGSDFARALLLSQAEASKYAANITKVLADQEKNPDHVRDLQRMSTKWEAIYDETFRLLRNY